jgi:hypothetical protein
LKNIDGKTLIWGKKYSITAEWGPSSGLEFFKFIPDRLVFSSKLLLLQSTSEIHNARRCNRDVDYYKFLEEIKMSIKYNFFNGQSDIISISTNEDTFLKTPFQWPQYMTNECE